jgi:hypothetical protein
VKKAPLYLMAIIIMFFGFSYLFVNEPMPYHQRFMAVPLKDIPGNVIVLFMYVLRIVGSSFICLAITDIILVHHHSKRNAWIRWALLIINFIILVPLLLVTLKVGLYSPWWVVVFLLVLNCINFFMLFREEKR